MESRPQEESNPTRSYKRPVGTYIPPAKRVKSEKFDVGSEDYQRFQWDEHKRKITGLINRANASNVGTVVKELFKCNLIRYKGIFASALLKAQEASPVYTDVYAALLAVINSRIRTIGALVVNRLILNYRVSFISNNKHKCLSCVKLIAHLTNQEVVHEVLGFQLIDHLIAKPTPASIEIAITFIKECGSKLDQLNPPYLFGIFKSLRELSLEKEFDSRTHEMIDFVHTIRKDKFKDFPPIKKSLDLIDESDRITHTVELSKPCKTDFHMELNYFKFDDKWSENEAKYEEFKKSLEDSDDEEDSSEGEDDGSDEDEQDDVVDSTVDSKDHVKIKKEDDEKETKPKIIDETGADTIAFRRNVYLIYRNSLTHEEVVHKIRKHKLDNHCELLCQMILDCCGQERTYVSLFGLSASRFCQIRRRDFATQFERMFQLFYETIHRFETNRIRNIARFYADLLATESISWSCLSCLKLRENVTSSAGRCFIKFLFEYLVSTLSMKTLLEYKKDPAKEEAFKELFPRDQEQDSWFSVNFFTFSGLGDLIEDLRQELMAKQ